MEAGLETNGAPRRASEWLAALLERPDDDILRRRFDRWLAADPVHAADWAEMARTYAVMGRTAPQHRDQWASAADMHRSGRRLPGATAARSPASPRAHIDVAQARGDRRGGRRHRGGDRPRDLSRRCDGNSPPITSPRRRRRRPSILPTAARCASRPRASWMWPTATARAVCACCGARRSSRSCAIRAGRSRCRRSRSM